jgi:hypothetical protein
MRAPLERYKVLDLQLYLYDLNTTSTADLSRKIGSIYKA